MVTLLIQKGAIVDHANNDGKTALHIAAEKGNMNRIKPRGFIHSLIVRIQCDKPKFQLNA